MAEALVIPLLALGGLYTMMNATKKSNVANANKDGFNMPASVTNLPTVTNYPNVVQSDVQQNPNYYSNPNEATATYLNQSAYQAAERNGLTVGQTPQNMFSVNGNINTNSQYIHNLLTPFEGGKIKGQLYNANIAESILDNKAGTGSQVIRKVEQAPLFQPQPNMSWAHGTPDNGDFLRSRVNPSMRANDARLFEPEHVAPGLNQGYSSAGFGGFNAGMEARDAILPKTVDELRGVVTNPKLTYSLAGLEGPADGYNKIVGTKEMMGIMNKNRPDTFYIQNPNRWLTTTGASKGETLHAVQVPGVIRRSDGAIDYMGTTVAAGAGASYVPENYEGCKRGDPLIGGVNPSAAIGHGQQHVALDQRMATHSNYSNARTTNEQPRIFGSGFSGAIGAAYSGFIHSQTTEPLRKDETVFNGRIFGNATGMGAPAGPVETCRANTTIKETTLYEPHQFFGGTTSGGAMYVNNAIAPGLTERDLTQSSYMGPAGGQMTSVGNMTYSAAYNTNQGNDIKSQTINNRPNMGGTQMFNPYIHVSTCKDDCDRFAGRVNPPGTSWSAQPPSAAMLGASSSKPANDIAINIQRMNPDLLNAFRENPYTHSLTSAV